jgi:hypothetical protein
MKVAFHSLLPALAKLGKFFQDGLDHYVSAQKVGKSVDADSLGVYLTGRMKNWDPKVKGVKIMDPDTTKAAARFISGVVVNISRSK